MLLDVSDEEDDCCEILSSRSCKSNDEATSHEDQIIQNAHFGDYFHPNGTRVAYLGELKEAVTDAHQLYREANYEHERARHTMKHTNCLDRAAVAKTDIGPLASQQAKAWVTLIDAQRDYRSHNEAARRLKRKWIDKKGADQSSRKLAMLSARIRKAQVGREKDVLVRGMRWIRDRLKRPIIIDD